MRHTNLQDIMLSHMQEISLHLKAVHFPPWPPVAPPSQPPALPALPQHAGSQLDASPQPSMHLGWLACRGLPTYFFRPVWCTLYLLMALSAALINNQPEPLFGSVKKRVPLLLFSMQVLQHFCLF